MQAFDNKSIALKLWEFIRGDCQVVDFEAWVYTSTDLENEIPSELYSTLIGFDFKFSSAKEIRLLKDALRQWLETAYSYTCHCVKFANNDKYNISVRTFIEAEMLKYDHFEQSCKIHRYRTPWLLAASCLICHNHWYVGIDPYEDVFCLKRIDNEALANIISANKWPTFFDADPHFWPSEWWLSCHGYQSLEEWQNKNNEFAGIPNSSQIN